MIYWCPVCKETRSPEEVDRVMVDYLGFAITYCETCGGEVVPATNCRIHGTSALDEVGECAKC